MPSAPRTLPFWLAFVVVIAGCGGAGRVGEAVSAATVEGEHTHLVSERRALAALTTQLATARAAHRDTAELERQLSEGRAEVARLASQLDQHLVDYLNLHRPTPGQARSGDDRRVLDVKIAEDLAAAEEFIREGGDYGHAIQIYRDLAALDPGNAHVAAALAAAEAGRTLSPERLASLKKGMNRDQVRATLGMPHLKNIQTFEEQGVVAWFYPTTAGGTAGVYFQAEGEGEPVVYRWDFATLTASAQAPATSPAASQ